MFVFLFEESQPASVDLFTNSRFGNNMIVFKAGVRKEWKGKGKGRGNEERRMKVL